MSMQENLEFARVGAGEDEARATAQLVLRMVERVFNRHDPSAVREYFAEDVVDHNPGPGQGPGVEGVEQMLAMCLQAFPDMTFAVDEMITSGDRVTLRWTTEGTHLGDFLGIPRTHRRVATTGIEIYRIEAGRIVERWGNLDQVTLLQQLGALRPAP